MTLFIDMDEVMADTYNAHIAYYNAEFGEKLRLEQCMGREVWQCVPENRRQSIYNHTSKAGFFRNLSPMPGSQEVIGELCQKFDVYVASAAMEFPVSLKEKSEWLDEHFPFLHWKKRILCGDKHILRGDILIDDRSYNLEHFIGRPLLFTSPHNLDQNGFERVANWQEVAERLL